MIPEKQFTPVNELISLRVKRVPIPGVAMGIKFAIACRPGETGVVV